MAHRGRTTCEQSAAGISICDRGDFRLAHRLGNHLSGLVRLIFAAARMTRRQRSGLQGKSLNNGHSVQVNSTNSETAPPGPQRSACSLKSRPSVIRGDAAAKAQRVCQQAGPDNQFLVGSGDWGGECQCPAAFPSAFWPSRPAAHT